MEKHLYQEKPPSYEYHLTDAGKGLVPVIQSMTIWADNHIHGVSIPNFGHNLGSVLVTSR